MTLGFGSLDTPPPPLPHQPFHLKHSMLQVSALLPWVSGHQFDDTSIWRSCTSPPPPPPPNTLYHEFPLLFFDKGVSVHQFDKIGMLKSCPPPPNTTNLSSQTLCIMSFPSCSLTKVSLSTNLIKLGCWSLVLHPPSLPTFPLQTLYIMSFPSCFLTRVYMSTSWWHWDSETLRYWSCSPPPPPPPPNTTKLSSSNILYHEFSLLFLDKGVSVHQFDDTEILVLPPVALPTPPTFPLQTLRIMSFRSCSLTKVSLPTSLMTLRYWSCPPSPSQHQQPFLFKHYTLSFSSRSFSKVSLSTSLMTLGCPSRSSSLTPKLGRMLSRTSSHSCRMGKAANRHMNRSKHFFPPDSS